MPLIKIIPVYDHKFRGMCRLPYTGHKNGCPNFSKNSRCPPQAPYLEDYLDLSDDIWAIYNIYDLAAHVEKMKIKHPKWSERQLYNCLYWQPSARKSLREEINRFWATEFILQESNNYSVFGVPLVYSKSSKAIKEIVIADTPEAMGANITETMKAVGIVLEWPPKTVAYQVVLAGYAKGK